jgi:uncharacterized protein
MSEPGAPDRAMRRAEREITDPVALAEILREASVLFLALRDHPAPYVLPVCFAHEEGILYIHSAMAGTKIDLMTTHPVVGFSACTELVVVPGSTACGYTSRARSVVGTGRARIVDDPQERSRGLDAIMRHYATVPEGTQHLYQPGPLARTCVIAIRIDTLRGKQTG